MKVLIVGEYSGVGAGLKFGFDQLGIHCDHIKTPDGYKNIGNSLKKKSALMSHILMCLSALEKSLRFKYDLAIFLSPFVFNRPLYINKMLNSLIINSSNKNILLCCTSDSVWWNDWPEKNIRSPRIGALLDRGFKLHPFCSPNFYDYNISFAEKMDKVFTLGACYSIAYSNTEFNTVKIHYPLVPPIINKTEKEIDFYHGITRPGMKGSELIKSLINKVSQKHPKAQIKITTKVDFQEYESILDHTKVYFDQIYSYGPGMSSLSALYRVPLVATGIKSAPGYEKYISDCPCVDILDNLDNLESFVFKGDYKTAMKNNRDFIHKYHDPVKVVKSILDEF